MRIASIDIGTNTILMLIADLDGNNISVIKDEHYIARLGAGIDKHGIIQPATFDKALGILKDLKDSASSNGAQYIIACGTSAFRDAVNSDSFINFIRERLSIGITVLSGKEEAELTYLGAVSEYLTAVGIKEYAVLDIGGGSTELVTGSSSNIKTLHSIDIGSVRITERLLKTSPPEDAALDKAREFIQEHIRQFPIIAPTASLIGVAGTLTTLAAIDLKLKSFDRSLINRHILSLVTIDRIYHELRPLTIDQLKKHPQIHPDRADILIAGILILKEIMDWSNSPQICVSDRGLRYGALLKYSDYI